MGQIVEIQGYGEVEFPDGMTDDQIKSVIKQKLPQWKAALSGQRGRANDPWAEFKPADPKDPWAEFKPAGPQMVASHGPAAQAPGFSEAEMMADLAKADESGDTRLAQTIAARIKAQRAAPSGRRLSENEAAALGLPPGGGSSPGRRLSSEEARALGLPVDGPPVGRSESAARGALQGASFGFGDEAAGAVAALLPFTDREAVGQGQTLGERYRNARDFYRGRNAAAETANPGTYLAGEFSGAVLPAAVTGGATLPARTALPLAIGQGAAQGAGYSRAEDAAGIAKDAGVGAALGAAGQGVATGVQKGAGRLVRYAQDKLGLASARAGAQAAGEVAEQVASARGALGSEVQKGSRYVENLMRLEAAMTPEQRALYAQLEKAGVVPALQQSVAQGTLERLPGQASTIAEKKAALEALTTGAPDAVKARTAELLRPQMGADTRSFLKSYAEPLAWAYGANKVAEELGADPETRGIVAAAAGIVGGRTRAGKALKARITRPGNQAAYAQALADAMARVQGSRALPLTLGAGLPALVIDSASEK